MDIRKFVKPDVASLTAYQAKEISCRVKLDANESPYGFDTAWKILKSVKTNRYPDPEAKALKSMISRDLKVGRENILQGNGSDELIYYLVAAFGGPIMYPVPTFSMFGIIAQALGEKRLEIPLDEDFDLDIRKMLLQIRNGRPKLIFLSSPNNPTGNCFSSDRILKIIESAKGSIVVVDEAYQPFASDKGFIPMLSDYENLVIMRTLSKIGLAGLRVGFLIGDEKTVHEVNKVRLPFNVNSLSQATAIEVLRNRALLRKNIRSIVTERDRLFRELSKMEEIHPYPSEANFILFKVSDSEKVYKGLLRHGVLVRNMKGVVDGCLRVTVGTPEENRMFIESLRRVLER